MDLFFIGALFLAWNLGRNNLSNLFGTAIATRMLSAKSAGIIGTLCVILGMLTNSSLPTKIVANLGFIASEQEAFLISISAAFVLIGMTFYGIPASISQLSIGSMIGLFIFYERNIDYFLLKQILLSWILSPFIALFISFFSFKLIRILLNRYPIRLLYRDIYIRFCLIFVGSLLGYAVGSNNIASIVGPFVKVTDLSYIKMFLLVGIALGVGFFTVNKKVIKTIGKSIFPITPLEAFISVFSCSMTLLLFSSQFINKFLILCHLPPFPIAPIPLAIVLVSSILGIALVKGPQAIKIKPLFLVTLSWLFSPLLAGLLCYIILTLLYLWKLF